MTGSDPGRVGNGRVTTRTLRTPDRFGRAGGPVHPMVHPGVHPAGHGSPTVCRSLWTELPQGAMMGSMSNADQPDEPGSGDETRGIPRRRLPREYRPAAGMLLVATSELQDPHFRRTVVYLVAHGGEGSAGLVLNRRTETAVHSVLPGWAGHVTKPQAVYSGGPVQPSGAMCLGVSRGGYYSGDGSGLVRVAGRVVLVDLDSEPAVAAATLTGVRIFAGHSGWGEGQRWRLVRGARSRRRHPGRPARGSLLPRAQAPGIPAGLAGLPPVGPGTQLVTGTYRQGLARLLR
jgi:putative AlgH/UPF0301 family transcriptional regulator